MLNRSARLLRCVRGSRLVSVGVLAIVIPFAWTASAVALPAPALPTVMSGSNSKGRTLFSVKPKSIDVHVYYKTPPEGYPRDEHYAFYGTLVKLKWSSWTATRGTATSTFISAVDESHERASVVLSHPRKGTFTQLSVKGSKRGVSFSTTVYDASQDLWTGTL